MKMNSRNLLQSAAVTAALILLAATAQATDLYWGGGNTSISDGTALPVVTTGTGFNGTWDTTTKNWSNNATSTVYQAWTSSVNDVSLGLVAAGASNAASQTLTLANGSNFTFSGRMYGGIFGQGSSQVFEFKPASGGNATVTLGGTSAVFDFTETVNNGTRGIQFDAGVSLAGSAQLILRGGSNMKVQSDSSAYTGAVRVENGVLKIDNSGSAANMRGATSFDIHNVNLGLGDMTSTTMNGNPTELILTYNSGLNAIASTANIALSGGAMQFIGIRSASTPTVQNAGSLTLNTFGFLDLSAVNGTAGSGLDAQLNFQSGLIRSSGNATSARDTLVVGVNSTGTLAGNTAAVTFTGGSATYGNNLLPWASTTRAEFLKINASNVLEVVASTQAATDLSTWSGGDIRVGNNTSFTATNSIGTTSINSLGLFTSNNPTLTIGTGNTLTIASGGIAYQNISNLVTLITGGSITTSSNNTLYIGTGSNAFGGLTIASVITGNIDVVKSGFAPVTFNAASANTYTGTTYVNGGTVTLNTGNLIIPGALVINNGGTVQFKVAGQIAANSAITINEGGFFNIGNGQTLTTSGGITINNGQLYVGNGGLAANGGLAFNGGFLTMGVASGAHTVTLGGNVSYASSATTAAVFEQDNGIWAGAAINSNLSLGNAARTFNIADSSTMSEATPEMTIGLSITSTGSSGQLVKTGDGVLRLTGGVGYSGSTYSGQNTYTGGTTINAGTLNVGFVSNIGVTANATATGAPTGIMVFFAAPVKLIVGQKLTGSDNFVASIISPTQVLMTSSTGLTTTGALTSYSFDATVAQSGSLLGNGTVTINGGASGDTPALLADSGVTTANAITVGSTGASRTIGSSSTSGTATYTGNITLNGGVILSAAAGGTVAFNTGTISGAGGVSKSGAGTVTLAGTNSYTGATSVSLGTLNVQTSLATSGVTVSGGSLALSGSGTLGSGTVTSSGGTIDLGGKSITNTLGALTGGGNVNNGTITNNSGTYAVQSGSVGAVLAGSNVLTKSGAGSVTLSAANTYTGLTTISAGTLVLASTGTIASSSGVNLGTSGSQGTLDLTAKSGGFSLGSSQTLSGYGNVTMAAGQTLTVNGGLAPGNSPGVIAISGNLALGTNATTTMDLVDHTLAAGTGFDQISLFGTTPSLTYAGTLMLNVSLTTTLGTYNLFTGFTSESGTFANGITYSLAGAAGTFNYTNGDLTLTAVPEPATWALLAFSLTTVMVLRRRRS